MKKVFAVTFVSLLAATPVLAEWNPVKDTANQVKGSATQQAQQTKDAQVKNATAGAQSVQDQATMAGKRKALGKSAKGKTDAEVNKLYEEKMNHGKAVSEQAKSATTGAQAGHGTDVKAVATQKAQDTTNQKTQEATSKGFEKLNKSLGQ